MDLGGKFAGQMGSGGAGGSEVAEDLVLLVPIHLRGSLLGALGMELLLGLCGRGA